MRGSMHTPCRDCGADTTPCTGRRGCRHTGRWEWYMIRPALWAAAGAGDSYLCIACLELRLGHTLQPGDFMDLPINEPHPWDTARLAGRRRTPGLFSPFLQVMASD